MRPSASRDQSVAKWLAAGAVSFLVLQSGLVCTSFSPGDSTQDRCHHPASSALSATRAAAAAAEDEKEAASDSSVNPRPRRIDNESGEQTTSCATCVFPQRPQEELAAAVESWTKATEFASKRKLTFLTKETLTFHRDKIASCDSCHSATRGSRHACCELIVLHVLSLLELTFYPFSFS
jgi:hypothetical protein